MASEELRKALAGAGIELREGEDVDAGRLYEFAPRHIEGARGFVVTGEDETHLGVRVDLPPDSPLSGAQHSGREALLALGALTAAFAGDRISAKLVTGGRGVEAVLLTTRRCGRVDEKAYRAAGEVLVDAAATLHAEIAAGPVDTLYDRLVQRRRPADSTLLDVEVTEEPDIVPSFDPATRDRLLGR